MIFLTYIQFSFLFVAFLITFFFFVILFYIISILSWIFFFSSLLTFFSCYKAKTCLWRPQCFEKIFFPLFGFLHSTFSFIPWLKLYILSIYLWILGCFVRLEMLWSKRRNVTIFFQKFTWSPRSHLHFFAFKFFD